MAMNESIRYPTIEDMVGGTPLVRWQRLPGDPFNVIHGKLEGNNPAGSVKDRPALSMISEAESRGTIVPGDTLIEATSGNTGIALAMAAAVKGYRIKLIMPANQSEERKLVMRAYGAELIEVKTFDTKVMLRLWVKVRSGWSDDARALKTLGLDVPEER